MTIREHGIEPREPGGAPLRFATRARLQDHVRDHVIEGRREKWWKILGEEPLGEAKREILSGGPGAAFQALAREYQGRVSDAIRSAAAQGRHHVHGVKRDLEIDGDGEAVLVPKFEGVTGFDQSTGIFFAAARPVRNGGGEPYFIRTGFVPTDPEGRIMKKGTAIKVKTMERMAVYGVKLVADHWGDA